MSSSAHIDNTKDILFLGKGLTQGLEHILTAEKMYSVNLLMVNKIRFKAKDSAIVATPLSLGNI